MSSWLCPGCEQQLQRQGDGTHVAWACSPCKMIWVIRTSLVSVLGRDLLFPLVSQLDTAPPSSRTLICPKCRQESFKAIQVGSMELDLCSQCHSLVLDPDEAMEEIRWELSPNVVKPDSPARERGFWNLHGSHTGPIDQVCDLFWIIGELLDLFHL